MVINVTATATVYGFDPALAFGINTGCYSGKANYQTLSSTSDATNIQAAGPKLVRYPGGTLADFYHWNGTGAYTPAQTWNPSTSAFTPGFACAPLSQGTTSNGSLFGFGWYSNLTDGDTSTSWKSLTTLATAQWVYVDLGSAQSADSVDIQWSTPYATAFLVQYWTGAGTTPWGAPLSHWSNAATVTAGAGGAESVPFTAASSQFWRIYMTASSGAGYAISELQVLDGATVLTTNTKSYANQSPAYASSMDPGNSPGTWNNTDFDFESFMSWCQNIGAQPLITVNFGSGTPEEAAAWVSYANTTRGYGIKYWEIGNEMHGPWELGGPVNADDYATRFMQFSEAMKAADPGIKVGGPVFSGTPTAASELNDNNPYIQDFLNSLAGSGKTADLDFLAFHNYPSPVTVAASVLASTNDWDTWGPTLRSYINAAYGSPSAIPMALDEFNLGQGVESECQLVNGLWVADYLLDFLKNTGSMAAFWTAIAGLSQASDGTWGDGGYLENGSLPPALSAYSYQPRAPYWAFRMLTNDFSMPGSGNNSLVAASSSDAEVDVYADSRADGTLTLAVVNKDQVNSKAATITLAGYTPAAGGTAYTLSSAGYVWNAAGSSSYANPDIGPSGAPFAVAGSTFSYTFPAFSLSVLSLAPLTSPTTTPSFTASPSGTFSPSTTPTLTATPSAAATATPTLTAMPSAAATATPTASPSAAVLLSPSVSPSFTVSGTPNPSPSQSPTAIASSTASASTTPSPTPSGSGSGSGTWTPSLTMSASRTGTCTSTPSAAAFTVSPTVSPTVMVTLPPAPTTATVPVPGQSSTGMPYPNPFWPLRGESLRLNVHLQASGPLSVKAFNLAGVLVRDVWDGEGLPGGTLVQWDGRNGQGDCVATGMYVLVVSGPGLHATAMAGLLK